VGTDAEYPDLTIRDAAAVRALALTPSPSGRGQG
jgi:hypothetical protein